MKGLVLLKVFVLIAAMLAYDLFWIWAVGFSISWAEPGETLSIEALPLWAMASTTLVVSGYCISKLAAIWRGENPRI